MKKNMILLFLALFIVLFTTGAASAASTSNTISTTISHNNIIINDTPTTNTVNKPKLSIVNQTKNNQIQSSNIAPDPKYVSTTGSDTTGTGTQTNPYRTIGKGISTVNSGGIVYLAKGTYNIAGDYGLTINRDLTISGAIQTNTIINGKLNQIFNIGPGFNVTLENLTLTNASSTLNGGAINDGNGMSSTLNIINCTFQGNNAIGSSGGAVYVSNVTLNVIKCTFTNNTADNGGAIYNNAGKDTITNSKFTSNKASDINGGGGAIYTTDTLIDLNNTYTQNTASGFGGAISTAKNLTETNGKFIGNSAAYGGAITNQGFTITDLNNTYTNNIATVEGGAINTYGTQNETNGTFTNNTATGQVGGAIFNSGGTSNDTNNKYIGNSAPNGSGGAIFTYGTINETNGTFINNTAGSGGAIFSYGTVNDLKNKYTNNTATSYYGGAICSFDSSALLTETGSTFTNNSAFYGGGAIYNGEGILNESQNTFKGNSVTNGDGGAIFNGDTFTDNNSTYINNNAFDGGAIYTGGFTTVPQGSINNSQFINNTATDNGGAIYNNVQYNTVPSIDMINDTFTNNTALVNGGAIYNYMYNTNSPMIINITNDTFTNNTANNGGAIFNYATYYYQKPTSVNITNSKFNNNNALVNGGAVYNIGNTYANYSFYHPETTYINNSTFTSNNANGNGGAIYNDGGTTGRALININTSTLTMNTATNGGAIYNTNSTGLGNITVTNSTLLNNTATNLGGGLYNNGTANLNFNRIVFNNALMGTQIYQAGGTIKATLNWWGTNSGPTGNMIFGTTNYTPWIVLSINANPTTIYNGGTSNITVDLQHDSNGIYHDPANGVVPYTGPAHFTATHGTIADVNFSNGLATSTFQATLDGTANVNSTVDNQTVSTSINIDTSADVQLNKTTSKAAPNVGQQFNYTVTATNNGPDTATGIVVTDVIPSGLIYNSYIASQGTYNSITGIWDIGTILDGANATLQLYVTPTSSLAGTNVTNIATKTAQNEYDPTIPDTANVTVHVPIADVQLIKTTSNASPNVGQKFNYTINVTNNGPDTATGVIVTDVIPSGLTYNSYTASSGTTYNSITGIWNIGTLNNGNTAVLNLFVTPTASAANSTITNTATKTAQNEYDPTIPDTYTVSVFVPISADVQLTKTTSNTSPNVGQKYNYTVTAKNNGPDTATGIVVSDVIPSGLTYNSYTASQGTYNSTTGIWNIGILLNGANATLKLYVTPTSTVDGKSVTNVATKTAQNEYDPTTPDTANVTVKIPFTITIAQLEAESLYVKNYYESHSKNLPTSVTISGQAITMPQFLQLLVTGTININNNNLNPLTVIAVKPAPSPSGTFTAGNLQKTAYLTIAQNIKNFITTNGRAPNFATTSLGKIPFSKLVYMYSKIINYYGINHVLPNYVSIAS